MGHKVQRISSYSKRGYSVTTNQGKEIRAEYLVNVAGGNSMDVAHMMGVAQGYTDLHFRGEYLGGTNAIPQPDKTIDLFCPKAPEYPFLDPHWIVRADDRREVGPNAVPVFGPYAYGWRRNLADMVPKIMESTHSGAGRYSLTGSFCRLQVPS